MVVTNDDRMAEIARSVKDHGYNEIERRSLLELEALYTYVHHRIGYNYRMTEMQAAIGLKALDRIAWNLERRRENAHYLTERLQACIVPSLSRHLHIARNAVAVHCPQKGTMRNTHNQFQVYPTS